MQSYEIQRSPEWHKWRAYHLGSSESSIIMGVSPWCTALELYHKKIKHRDLIENNPNWKELITSSDEDSFAKSEGRRKEPLALSLFESQTGYLMTPRVLQHGEYKWMAASFDGLELDRCCAVEIKAPGKTDHDLALKGIVPEKYFPQLQHQMEVAGFTEMYYMSYVSDDDFTIFKVQKDEDYTKKLLEVEAAFWEKVTNRIPPELTDKDILEINDPIWEAAVKDYKYFKSEIEDHEKQLQKTKEILIYMANNRSAKGCGIQLTKSIRKGQLDYQTIVKEKLPDVNLEPYRKPSYESWMVTLKEE